MMKNNYMLLCHQMYADRIINWLDRARQLKTQLSREEYIRHPIVKLLARIFNATLKIIPCDPNNRDYLLKGVLAKFRRYKAGLQRFRLIFCFSKTPSVIVYLYVNDAHHIRKEGDKNDPYQEFKAFVKKGIFSHNPDDIQMKQWIRNNFEQEIMKQSYL